MGLSSSLMEPHFSLYLNGQKQDYVITEDDRFMAIMEEHPLVRGHCVVFPKRVVDSWLSLSDEESAEIMVFAKKIGKAIEQVVTCKKIGVAVIGLQVKHAHVHLVPIDSADDLNFTRPKLDLAPVEMKEFAAKIKSHLL
jgi:histidine triad (HIT) family protein